jgi:2-C-methyl-D-erythritol 4-phosphate cytidylyltransferase
MTDSGDVDAIVLAAGLGARLGLGPKARLVLGGRTLLDRAVATMRLVAGRVIVGAAAHDLDRARALGGDVTVVPGGATHRQTTIAGLRAAQAPLVLIHDVAHPFVTPTLARQVIAAARQHGAAVAAVVATTASYRWSGAGKAVRLAGPGHIWTVRRPVVVPRADFWQGLREAPEDESISTLLARVGVETVLVPSPSWNIKITTPDDWALAHAIEGGLRPVP